LNGFAARIGLTSVVLLVLLRISIGWHFLYEGVWKLVQPDFSAESYLLVAKGPLAPMFYAMVPDLYGRQRLQSMSAKGTGDSEISAECYLTAWRSFKDEAVKFYAMDETQQKAADALLSQYETSLKEYLRDHGSAIRGYFTSLELFEARERAGTNGAIHEQERLWQEQRKLWAEVRQWLDELDGMGRDFQAGIWALLNEDQQQKGLLRRPVHTAGLLPIRLPFAQTWMELINFSVSWGLTAIGICLIAGLFTRLAALGGAAFLTFIIMTQPHLPNIYPLPPEVVGHFLFVDKNFVELVALLVLASTAVGQWGGLDFFVYWWVGRPILRWIGWVSDEAPVHLHAADAAARVK